MSYQITLNIDRQVFNREVSITDDGLREILFTAISSELNRSKADRASVKMVLLSALGVFLKEEGMTIGARRSTGYLYVHQTDAIVGRIEIENVEGEDNSLEAKLLSKVEVEILREFVVIDEMLLENEDYKIIYEKIMALWNKYLKTTQVPFTDLQSLTLFFTAQIDRVFTKNPGYIDNYKILLQLPENIFGQLRVPVNLFVNDNNRESILGNREYRPNIFSNSKIIQILYGFDDETAEKYASYCRDHSTYMWSFSSYLYDIYFRRENLPKNYPLHAVTLNKTGYTYLLEEIERLSNSDSSGQIGQELVVLKEELILLKGKLKD